MKKILLLTSLFIFASPSFAATSVSLYGDEDYPPYSYLENGEMKGIYTEVLKKVIEKMPDYNIELKGTPWKRGLANVESGQIFALYPPYYRPDSRPYMEYETAILNEELTLYCSDKITQEDRKNWPEDYHGLTIANNAGFSAGGEQFWTDVKAGKITVKETKGTNNNLKKLIHRRVDCYLNDGLSIEWALKQLKEKGVYNGSGVSKALTISAEQGYLGFATNGNQFSYKNDFTKKYNFIVNEMKSSGEVDKIIANFLK
ncbi:MAG: polar amino acid transport system substrate-binding protein [Cocleimonas sp.]|jgi:polar amino acid transport system substrate-binding protein